MSEIIKFQLASGEFVYMDAEADATEELRPASRGKKVIATASETFEAALEQVKPAARAVVEAFREFNEPDEIGLEFGIQFKSSVDAFVLTGEANATLKLSLKWKRDKA